MDKEGSQAMLRVCPVCEKDKADLFWRKGDVKLVQCGECGMVYANLVAPGLASGSFYQDLTQRFYLSPDKLESDYAAVRFERELRLFRAFCQRGRVLDVGCSTGSFLHQLTMRWPGDYEVLGTDVAGEALEYAASQGVRVMRESFLEYAPGEARFDAVTFWAVLEHVVAPKKFLVKAAELLKPGGHCFILAPNFRSLAVRMLGAKYRYVMAEHVNYFTAKTLRELAGREPRLRVVKFTSTHFNPVVIWEDWKRPRERVEEEERARLLKRTTGWKEHAWGPVRGLYGMVEGMLGRAGLGDNLAVVLRRGTDE